MQFLARSLCLVALVLGLSAPAVAQDDRGYLQGLLEDNLSGIGREVRIIGFEGALSSRASIETLTIADDDGIWLRMDGLALDWERSALLQGAIKVTNLSAAQIHLVRFPKAQPVLPDAEATAFVLPELPVSIDIGTLAAEKILLGAAILGMPAEMRLMASASLADGAGQFAVEAQRTDGIDGEVTARGAYSNDTGILAFALDLTEQENGLAATMLGLPGQPSLAVTLSGDGPLGDFGARFALATGGVDRLSGQARIVQEASVGDAKTPGDLGFDITLGGDVRPLFAPEYARFFGTELRARLHGMRRPDGGLSLSGLDVTTQELALGGSAEIGADGWPSRIAVAGTVASQDGAPVLLPIGEAGTALGRAEILVVYDAAQSDQWRAQVDAQSVASGPFSAQSLALTGQGHLRPTTPNAPDALRAELLLDAKGLRLADAGHARAMGDALSAGANLRWGVGHPLILRDLDVQSGTTTLRGDVDVAGMDAALDLDIAGEIALDTPDLARFAALIGQDLGGALSGQITGRLRPISGAFDGKVMANTNDLRTGLGAIDGLLGGEGALSVEARRDGTGLQVQNAQITTPHVALTASGQLSKNTARLQANGRLRDVSQLVPSDLQGPAQFDVSMKRADADWMVELAASGPSASRVSVAGTMSADFETGDMQLAGRIPLGALNGTISPNVLSGMVDLDLRIAGPIALSSLSGDMRATGAKVTLPDARLALQDTRFSAQLSQGRAVIDARARSTTGGRIEASGPIELSAPFAADLQGRIVNLRLSDGASYETEASGTWSVRGALMGAPAVEADITLGQTEIKLAEIGAGLPAVLEGVAHVGDSPAMRQTRARAGISVADTDAGAIDLPIDIQLSAPSRVFVRGRGLDAELGGQVRLAGSTGAVISLGRFDLVRGRLDILGKRLLLDQGYAQLRGNLDPAIFLVASTQADGTDIDVTISGVVSKPEVRFGSSPQLPEDEVLALLLFGRGIAKISAVQALQLAAAVRTLAGNDAGLLNTLRQNFGLDDLDVTTSEDGEIGARVGKYLSDNVYSDVTIGGGQPSEINLNLILTPQVTARGRVNEDGESALGLFFETEY